LDKIPEPADETVFDEQKKYANLYAMLEKLPFQRRNILELAVFQSLSYNEIAERLHISRNTVKTQISRAYRFLKENLDPEEFYFFFLTHR
jgi:RNA polymerase sigma-70 factor (ECF subfamily)